MKAYIASMSHETNTFSPIPTNIQSFRDALYYDPDTDADKIDIRQMMGFQGFAAQLDELGYESVIGPVAMAAPGGPLVRRDYEQMRDHILEHLKRSGKFDIVFLFLHGAMLAAGYDDCEGDLTRRVRAIVGPKVPIGVLLDLHCDITEELIGAATVVAACKEYPHTDLGERGTEIVVLLDRTRKGEITPVMVRRFVPMISFFHTTNQPMRGLVDQLFELEKDPILMISLAHGFPWSDSPYAGAHVLIVSDDADKESKKLAERLVKEWVPLRGGSADKYVDITTALDRATAATKGPVVIADVADNPGGGAAADSTFILREVLDRKLTNVAMAIMWDSVAVDIARAAGEGASLGMRIGGKVSPQSGSPVDLPVTIGKIVTEPHATLVGKENVWIALTSGDVEIVLTNVRTQVFTPDVFTEVGIDPTAKDIVVVKSSQHFRAGFDPIAAETIYCDTPGTLNSDLASMPFKRIPRPMWPMDDIPTDQF
jgi:microcystin degradation protein MlrC